MCQLFPVENEGQAKKRVRHPTKEKCGNYDQDVFSSFNVLFESLVTSLGAPGDFTNIFC